MNKKALHKISYGLYIVCSKKDKKFNGQIANSVFQVTAEPPTIAVSINKQNLTHEYIEHSKVFTMSILCDKAPMTYIGAFGYKSGRDFDKFKDVIATGLFDVYSNDDNPARLELHETVNDGDELILVRGGT